VQEHLLATKFFVPASSRALIPRPHLDILLQEGIQRQLTLVSAPAGFGKTTLLANWVQSLPKGTLENHRVAWVSLDEADKSAVRFWTYVLTALDKSEPGVATAALRMLQAPHTPILEEVLTIFINVLSQMSNSYVLILDDFYLVNDPVVHTSLNYLIEHQPPQLHLIISTRIDPPLNLPRLRARWQLLEVRADQLRCTPEEATAFLKEGTGTKQLLQQGLLDPLSERELEVLHLVAQGASNQEIAETLVLSVQTVKRHVYNILGKLEVSNRTQAVMCAQSLGLLSDGQHRVTTTPSTQKERRFLLSVLCCTIAS